MKDIYWGVQGDFKVALVRNGCLANWLNGLWMDYLVQKECMCKVENDIVMRSRMKRSWTNHQHEELTSVKSDKKVNIE
jgi:hypothetical protein